MKADLENNIEAEHTSAMGIALLWQEVTGTFTPAMKRVVE